MQVRTRIGLVIAAAAVVAVPLSLRNRVGVVEHVRTLPDGLGLQPLIRGGRIIWLEQSGADGIKVCSDAVVGGKVHSVHREAAVQGSIELDNSCVYKLQQKTYSAMVPLTREEFAALRLRPDRRAYIEAHAKPPTYLYAMGRAEYLSYVKANPHDRYCTITRSTLLRCPADGGPPRVFRDDILGSRVVVSGGMIYWVEESPSVQWWKTDLPKADSPWPQPLQRVLVAPVEGGPVRTLLERNGNLGIARVPDSGVLVYDSGTLMRFRTDGTLVYSVPDVGYYNGAPAELGGRLFVVCSIYQNRAGHIKDRWFAGSELVRIQLRSARLDGADRWTEMTLPPTGTLIPFLPTDVPSIGGIGFESNLFRVHRGKLYALAGSGSEPLIAGEPKPGIVLCQVIHGRRKPLVPLFELPPGSSTGQFDEGYFYCTGTAEHENWLAWSGAGMAVRTSQELYRIRLPD